ncbi:MAG: hypothetical protein HY811_04035 [Planctomycetes bacterium]|nr:hypothetical protein [Planctomycetota bacterium]
MKTKKWITLGITLVISFATICAEGRGCWGQGLVENKDGRYGSDTVSGSSGGSGSSSQSDEESRGGSSVVNLGPGKATNPTPVIGALGISRVLVETSGELRWDAPTGVNYADVWYEVYFGINYQLTEDDWIIGDAEDGDGDGRVTVYLGDALLDALEPQTTYYWRVDSNGPDGKTEGDTWWFITQ